MTYLPILPVIMKEILFTRGAQTVRRTQKEDLPRIAQIYHDARVRMHAGGNPTQWINHPKMSLIEADIEAGKSFVIEQDGEICGTFYSALEDDPTYHTTENGHWCNDDPYCVIHRIAGDGVHRGIMQTAVEYVQTICPNIRIDTHENNAAMQHVLSKLGFVRCGMIYIQDEYSDHSPRVAFQLAPAAN